jgi:hypothetical protein
LRCAGDGEKLHLALACDAVCQRESAAAGGKSDLFEEVFGRAQ